MTGSTLATTRLQTTSNKISHKFVGGKTTRTSVDLPLFFIHSDMGDSKLTIVIPVKNRAEIFERTLRSVAAQKLRPLKVVIVDNGSTDSTAETARSGATLLRQPV